MHLYRSKPIFPEIPDPSVDVEVRPGLVIRSRFDRLTLTSTGYRFKGSGEMLGGYEVKNSMVLKTLEKFETAEEAQTWFRLPRLGQSPGGIICNKVTDLEDDYQLYSLHNWTYISGSYLRDNAMVKEIYDLSGMITETRAYCFRTGALEVVSLPQLISFDYNTFHVGGQSMRLLEIPKVTSIPTDLANAFVSFPQGSNFVFNNALKTSFNGGYHPSLTALIANKNPNITWVD